MSKKIDQRIVEMSFENHKFEKGISQSKNSLKEFAGALNKMGSGKDFSGLENSVHSVSRSFSMMEQIGIGALRRIGEAAVNTGASLIKSLTVDQLAAGLNKYQEKIEAVQTMVSAGYGLDEVEESMARLMWFSDETSYSFTDMANNMGKFIAAGVPLADAESAMVGIATWAAHSGKNATDASMAMYNLSQSISMGYVGLRNWQSIMNKNMNTAMFKEIAISVGEASGAIQKGQVTLQNFDNNLKDRWFTSDLLLATLNQYSGYAKKVQEVQEEMNFDTAKQAMDYMDQHSDKYADVLNQIGNAGFKAAQVSKSFMDSINATMDAVSSGWLRTYEIIFGTLNEAIENFSALTEILWTIFASGAEARNEMLRSIKDLGGIKTIFQILKSSSVALLKPLKAVSEAFDQFFPPKTVDQWMGIIDALDRMTQKLIITDETADKIRRTFAGFFAVVDIGWQTVKFLGSALMEIVRIFIPLNGNLLSMTASVGDFLVVLNHVIKQSGVFEYALLGVRIAAMTMRDILTVLAVNIREFVRTLMTTERPLEFLGQTVQKIFAGTIEAMKTGIGWISGKLLNSLKSVQKFLDTKLNIGSEGFIGGILTLLKEFVAFLTGGATDTMFSFGDALKNLDFSKIATFVTGGVLLLFINQLAGLTGVMRSLLVNVNLFVTRFSKRLFVSQTKIRDFAHAVAVLSASLYVLSRIPWEDLKKGLKGLAGAMLIFVGAYAAIQAVTVVASKQMNGVDTIKSAFNLTALAGGLAIMAAAIHVISKIDESKVWKSVGVVAAMMGLLVAYQALSVAISLIPGTRSAIVKINGMATGLMGIIGVIVILNYLTPSTISNGLTKIAGVMLVIAGIQALFALASRLSGGNRLSINLIGMSVGIVSLIAVLKLLSLVNSRDITQGIGNLFLIGGVLAAIQVMFNLAGRLGGGVRAKTNMIAIQMGLISMIALSYVLGKMNQSNLQNGIKNLAKMTGIIAALQLLTAVAARIGGGNKLQRILGSVALTLTSFTIIIGILGVYKQETINKGLKAILQMAGIIVALQVVTALISKISNPVGNFATLLGLSTLLLTLTASLSLLSMINQEALRQASTSLAIAVVSMGALAVGIGVMTKALSSMSISFGGLKTIVKNLIPGFIVMSALVVGALAFLWTIKSASGMIESISWDTLAKFAVGLGMITVLTTAFTLLAKVPGLGSGASGLLGLLTGFAGMATLVLATAGMFGLLSSVLPIVDSISWSSFDKFLTGIAFLGLMAVGLTLLSPFLAILGTGFVPVIGGTLTAILGVGLVIGAFAGLAVLMEALFGSDPEYLLRGIDKMTMIAEGLGRFVGALVGGFSAELIAGFGEGLASFADSVSRIQSTSFDGIESLARAMMLLSSAALVDGLTRLLGFKENPGKVFGEQIEGLVEAFKKISIQDANKTTEVLNALSPMVDNLKALAQAAKSIPNSGGFIGAFMGENDVDAFGKQLSGFIKAFRGINIKATTHAKDVLNEMTPMARNLRTFASAASRIPNSGGFMAGFLGDNKIDDFGEQLTDFVGVFSSLSIERSIVPASESLNAMVPMLADLKLFIEASSSIPNSGGMVSWFTGDNTITKFGEQIEELVKTFGSFSRGRVTKAAENMSSITMNLLPGLQRLIILSNNLTAGGKQTRGNSFSDLAKEIKNFVDILKGVDITIVAPALASLEDINAAFALVGEDVISSSIRSIQDNRRPFQMAFTNLLVETASIIGNEGPALSKSFTDVLDKTLIDARYYVQDFRTLGTDLVRGLQTGIKSNENLATNATNNMAKAVIDHTRGSFEINSPSKIFSKIGHWLPAGLGVGIKRNANVAILASVNMAQGIEDAVRDTLDIHSIGKKFPDIGSWIPPGLSAGIESTKKSLLTTAENLGLDTSATTVKGITDGITGSEGALTSGINGLLELLTGSKTVTEVANDLGIKTGGAFSDGYVDGTDTKAIGNAYRGVAKDAFQAFKESIDRKREYNLMSAWEEIEAWEEFTKRYAKGTETRLKADKHLGRLRYEFSTKWIDKEKYYKRLSLDEELKAWERVQARYEKGHDYRMQAEREIFRLKQEIWQAEYQNSLDNIDEEKYYGRMNLSQELSEWKKINSTTKEGSDERKKADREIFRLENEIRDTNLAYEEQLKEIEAERTARRLKADEDYYNKSKEINDRMKRDIQSLTDEYESAVDSRAKTLYSTYGLFDKVEKPKYVSGFELINNLEDQNTAFDKWQNSIGTLAAKGVDDGLIKELRDMGPKSLAQINALNRLSSSELDRYVDLWQKKSKEAKDQAVFELQDLKNENEVKIRQITADAAVELNHYKRVWSDTLAQVDNDTRKKLDQLQRDWKKSIGTMSEDGITMIQKFRLDWFGEIEKIVDETKAKMKELENLTAIKPNLKPITGIVGAAASTTLTKTLNVNSQAAGRNIVNGLANGIAKNSSIAVRAMGSVNSKIYGDLNSFWMIKSPARKTIGVAKFIMMGLAGGIKSFGGLAIHEGQDLSDNLLAVLGSSIDAIPDLLSQDMDAFEITPILDLSAIREGMNDVNSIFGGVAGLDLTNTKRLLPKGSPTNQNGILADIRNGLLSMTNPELDLTGRLTVEVVNDKGEIVGIAETAIRDLLRRESR